VVRDLVLGFWLLTTAFRGDLMIGAKLKIALLYDVWNEDPDAAAAKEEAAAAPVPKPRKKVKKVKKEKTDREEIFEALQKLGHEPSYFELDGRPSPCTRFRGAMPT